MDKGVSELCDDKSLQGKISPKALSILIAHEIMSSQYHDSGHSSLYAKDTLAVGSVKFATLQSFLIMA